MKIQSDSKIRDINLWELGRKELDLAQVEMPGLMSCRQEFGNSQPLKGARLSGSLHLTVQTAVLIETLQKLGVDIRWCSCNIYSTQDQAAAALVKANSAKVFAWKGETIREYWECTMNALIWPNGQGPNILVDDGGDATLMILEGKKWEIKYEKTGALPDPQKAGSEDEKQLLSILKETIPTHPKRWRNVLKDFYGCSEETTTGVHKLYQLAEKKQLPFPAINVNDSVTKSKFDNIYGCRHSLIDGIFRATDVMVAGKKAVVCGYGDVGKGCVQALRNSGARVFVTEIDPICALQACMDGIEVVKLESVVKEADIFITATGNKHIIMTQHMSMMKNNAIVGNIGHFNNEIDTLGLKNWPGIKRTEIKQGLARYEFEQGNGILLLAEGRLLNLVCATGHPSFVMSCSFTNQTLAQIELWQNRNNNKYQAQKVYLLPKELDEKVASLHLKSLGAELTTLSKEQADYIGVPLKGPYKPQEYRY